MIGLPLMTVPHANWFSATKAATAYLERERKRKKKAWLGFKKKKEFSVVLTSPHLSVLSLFSPFRVAKKLPF